MKFSRSWTAWPRTGAERLQNGQSKTLRSPWSLRLQLVFLVTMALLPMSAWSVWQGVQSARHDAVAARELLTESADNAATPAENVLGSADEIARALSNLPSVRDVTPDCSQTLTSAQQGLMFFTNIVRLDASGRIVCASSPGLVGLHTQAQAAWANLKNSNTFSVTGAIRSHLTDRPIIVGFLPLRNPDGRFAGAIGIGVDLSWLDYMIRHSALPADSVVDLFERNGTELAANRPQIADQIFRGGQRPPPGGTLVGSCVDRNDRTWLYATHALLGDNVFVGFAERRASLFSSTYIRMGTDFGIPLLMIGLSWLAVWLVTERQLTRWIIYLRRVSAAYRAGHYKLKPALENAPAEFQLLGGALSEMASSIQDRDTSLRETVAQKTVLIREIHHRVKNNLQIVMSLLSLQAARIGDPTAYDALTQARARINALALVHRVLYEIEDQQSVDVKTLLQQLGEQTHEGFGGDRRNIQIGVDAASLYVTGDAAVPIALFAEEALTNAYKHAFPPGWPGRIFLSFGHLENGKYRLAVMDNGAGFDCSTDEASIGLKLIRTFGQQLGGETRIDSRPGEGTVAEMIFPAPRAR